MNRILGCVSNNNEYLPNYSENDCSVVIHKKGEFVFLINVESLQLNEMHCDLILAKIEEEKKKTITLYFIELKNTIDTSKEKLTEVLSNIVKKTQSFQQLEEIVKGLFSKAPSFSKQYIIFLSENTVKTLQNTESLLKRDIKLYQVKKDKDFEKVIIKSCNTTVFQYDGLSISI